MATVARCLGASLVSAALAQQVGQLSQEHHIPMSVESCKRAGGCTTEETQIVMDMQWRWIHNKDAYNNCLPGEFWDKDLCPDPKTCSQNCAMEGVDEKGYTENYKAWPVEKGIKLEFPNAPRVYMLDGEDKYKMFKLKNKEFTFDVDLSSLPCGMNAALYFVEMDEHGDKSGLNPGGAKYGAGYCDAQCPHMRYIRGEANLLDWEQTHSAMNPDGEILTGGHDGRYGYCCAEMDILEANTAAGVYTAHPCSEEKQAVCEGKEQCGDREEGLTGYCDKDGCGFSSYRMGDKQFWGPGQDFAVDTSKPMTIITQFVTHDNTDDGDLVDIRRLYLQDGKLFKNSQARVLEGGGDSLTDSMCNEQNKAFNQTSNGYKDAGGMKTMGEALGRGMVLSMSIWEDSFGRMLWLDGEKSRFDEDPNTLGVKRGPCPFKYGTHEDTTEYAKEHGSMSATFTNVRYGDLDSTYSLI